MRVWLRSRWPLVAGGLVAGGVLVAGVAGADLFEWTFLGVHESVWGVVAAVASIALVGQLAVSNRAAFQRERRLVRTAAQLREVSAELDRLARTDALTGIANRRAFFDLLGVEFRRSRRYARELSVLMLDLDHFKRVNDRWGHPFGDQVLRQTAETISANIRESDFVGRYGGEEFALAMPETGPEQALVAAEKLRRAIEEVEFRAGDVPPAHEPSVRVTISIGVASLPIEADQDEFKLIRRADQALYEAKRTGRNRVRTFTKETVSQPAVAEVLPGPDEDADGDGDDAAERAEDGREASGSAGSGVSAGA